MSATTPGLWARIGYLLGRPLPPQMREWVRRDITGRGNYRRYLVRGLVPFLPIVIALCFVPASWMVRAGMILILTIPFLYFQVALGGIYRRHLLRNNGLDPKLADRVTIIRLTAADEAYRRQHRPEIGSQIPGDLPAPPPEPRIIDARVTPPRDDA
ncbi:MAG: DUF5313 family protein [Gordonia sp. (in: high G+C Gram-positive bacteria)]|uniref:DUF5313 family protein n=1 Tax=Gordonia sp. (in: high G+C Gram-positive bacteria) TaxID=84139 RepID=UPI003BB54CBD